MSRWRVSCDTCEIAAWIGRRDEGFDAWCEGCQSATRIAPAASPAPWSLCGTELTVGEPRFEELYGEIQNLAAVLHDAQGTKGLKVIMIVSATAGEGKTLTAANLALTFSESYQRRVLLIDADLRRPALHGVFRIDSASSSPCVTLPTRPRAKSVKPSV